MDLILLHAFGEDELEDCALKVGELLNSRVHPAECALSEDGRAGVARSTLEWGRAEV